MCAISYCLFLICYIIPIYINEARLEKVVGQGKDANGCEQMHFALGFSFLCFMSQSNDCIWSLWGLENKYQRAE